MASTQPTSRTPEGEPNHCSICGMEVRLDPSIPLGDVPCPNCGSLQWFPDFASRTPDIIVNSPEHIANLCKLAGYSFRLSLGLMLLSAWLSEGRVQMYYCLAGAAAMVFLEVLAGFGLAFRDRLRHRLSVGGRVNPLLRLYFAAGWISFVAWIATAIGLTFLLGILAVVTI